MRRRSLSRAGASRLYSDLLPRPWLNPLIKQNGLPNRPEEQLNAGIALRRLSEIRSKVQSLGPGID